MTGRKVDPINGSAADQSYETVGNRNQEGSVVRRIKNRIDALKENRNKGAALVIAVIIMLLLTMLSLVLLTVSYSLHQTAYRQRNMEQCKEITQGICKEIHEELCTINNTTFTTVEEVKTAIESNQYPLWSYLRCSLWQVQWPYYNENESLHKFDRACRYFTLEYKNVKTGEEIPGEVTVAIYWESEKDVTKDEGDDTPVFIQVTCQIGKQKSTITSEYVLHIDTEVANKYTGATDDDKKYVVRNQKNNPYHNVINLEEKWYFTETSRE